MERLTCKYDDENVLRECCTFDRESNIEPDDVLTCDAICCFCCLDCSKCPIQKAFDKLAQYEDLEEQGRILILPCSENDTVYKIENNTDACYGCDYFSAGYYECDDECENKSVVYDGETHVSYPQYKDEPICDKQFLEIVEFKPKLQWIFTNRDYFGKTWFITRKEAEAALKKMNGD